MDDDNEVSLFASSTALEITRFGGYKFETIEYFLSQTAKIIKDKNWRLRNIGLVDTIKMLRRHWDSFEKYQKDVLFDMLYDPEIDIRNIASEHLRLIITNLPTQEIQKLVESFIKKCESVKKKLTEGNNQIILNGSILGLIAIARSFWIEIKPCVPNILAYLCKFRANYGVTSDAVRLCLSDFWKCNKEIWEHVKCKFTEEQQIAISEHINPYNYFC